MPALDDGGSAPSASGLRPTSIGSDPHDVPIPSVHDVTDDDMQVTYPPFNHESVTRRLTYDSHEDMRVLAKMTPAEREDALRDRRTRRRTSEHRGVSEHDDSLTRAQGDQIVELLTNQQVLTVQVQQLTTMVQEREAACNSMQSTIASMKKRIDSDDVLMRNAQTKYDRKKQALVDRHEEFRRMEAALTHHQALVGDLQRQQAKAQIETRTACD